MRWRRPSPSDSRAHDSGRHTESRYEETSSVPEVLWARDAPRQEARARAANRVDADLARAQDEALPRLAVTTLATGAFALVSFTLARMTDGWWWTAPFAAALATGAAAARYTRKTVHRTNNRGSQPAPRQRRREQP